MLYEYSRRIFCLRAGTNYDMMKKIKKKTERYNIDKDKNEKRSKSMEMAEGRKSVLEEGGINVDEAMQRFMNNEQLWIKFLKKFKADMSYENLVKAIEAKEWNKAFEAAHTLKGITGNLALSRLHELVSRQTDYLRGENNDFEAAVSMMPEITQVYENVLKLIDEVYGE